MAASSFTLRMGGNVALADGSIRSFNGFHDSRFSGQLVDTVQAMRDVLTSFPAVVASFITALEPTTVSNFTDSSSTDTVSEFTLHLSGNVAFDDDTVSLYDWEITPDGEVINHITGSVGNDALNEVAQVETLRLVLEAVWQALLDSSAVTVAA